MINYSHLRLPVAAVLFLALSLVLAACGGGGEEGGGGENGGGGSSASSAAGGSTSMNGGGEGASGEVAIEGSSTVQPITQAVAEGFREENPNVRTSVGGAGTGDGFEVFCKGETEISDASRPIESDEQEACEEGGVEYIELPVAYDGVSFVVNAQGNNWAEDITTEELKAIWEPDSKVESWSDVRSDWPDNPLGPSELFGPGSESGTFDFMAEKIADPDAEEPALRSNYQASENDNQLVEGVAGNPNAHGFFGFSYYENNQDTLRALALDGVEPTVDTIRTGEYGMSRPLFIYVSAKAAEENPAVEEFVDFYLGNVDTFVEQAQYVTLPSDLEQESVTQWEDRTVGTVYDENGELPDDDLTTALQQSQ